MPKFGQRSKSRLITCDKRLIVLCETVVRDYDCTVLEGYRNKSTQEAHYASGASKVRWPNSRHNRQPSHAVDLAPWVLLGDTKMGVPWDDKEQFLHFGGYVLGVAFALGVPIRWGGDWDSDKDLKDQRFNDLVHFELADG